MRRITAEIEGWSLRLPRLRQRLQHAPAGLLAPAWVPEESFTASGHVRLHPEVLTEADITPAILHGDANGELDSRLSPWNLLVVDVAGGDLLLVIKMHHVMGDGLSGVSTLDALLTETAEPHPAPPPPPAVRAPANSAELFSAAWRHFCSVHPSWTARRAAALAKPPLVRLRKVAGRNLRAIRSSRGHQASPVSWQYGVTSLPMKTAQTTARALGGSLTDLMAAAGAYGVVEARSGRRSKAVTIAVPVSEPRDGTSGMSNRTRIVPVTVIPEGNRAETVASVRAQSLAGVSAGSSAHFGKDSWDAMATFLPAGFRRRFFAGEPVRNILFWTSLDPAERIGILASNYLDTLNVTVVAAEEVDMDALLMTLRMVLTGAGPFDEADAIIPDPSDVWDSIREGVL
jgi:hypothetical protein